MNTYNSILTKFLLVALFVSCASALYNPHFKHMKGNERKQIIPIPSEYVVKDFCATEKYLCVANTEEPEITCSDYSETANDTTSYELTFPELEDVINTISCHQEGVFALLNNGNMHYAPFKKLEWQYRDVNVTSLTKATTGDTHGISQGSCSTFIPWFSKAMVDVESENYPSQEFKAAFAGPEAGEYVCASDSNFVTRFYDSEPNNLNPIPFGANEKITKTSRGSILSSVGSIYAYRDESMSQIDTSDLAPITDISSTSCHLWAVDNDRKLAYFNLCPHDSDSVNSTLLETEDPVERVHAVVSDSAWVYMNPKIEIQSSLYADPHADQLNIGDTITVTIEVQDGGSNRPIESVTPVTATFKFNDNDPIDLDYTIIDSANDVAKYTFVLQPTLFGQNPSQSPDNVVELTSQIQIRFIDGHIQEHTASETYTEREQTVSGSPRVASVGIFTFTIMIALSFILTM